MVIDRSATASKGLFLLVLCKVIVVASFCIVMSSRYTMEDLQCVEIVSSSYELSSPNHMNENISVSKLI